MRKSVQAIDGSNVSLKVPYTHMSYEDGCLFYGLMNALLTYANELLHVVPEREIVIDGDDLRRQNLGSVVSESLWRHPEIVEMFIHKNPYGLSQKQLLIVQPWKHAVRDVFINVQADRDVALHMNETRVFAAGAMEHDACDFVHGIPSLDLLVLLPFKGGIVTDGKVLHILGRINPLALPVVKDDCSTALSHGVIQSADELVAFSRSNQGRNWISPNIQSLIDSTVDRILRESIRQ